MRKFVKNLWLAPGLAGLIVGVFTARAQDVTNSNHTVVRFNVATGGTNFGSLDIELFDQEKPVTVRNFLHYVRSGGYSGVVLHRAATNFVLQGGHVTVPDAASTNVFNSYVAGPDYGVITNEYSVGPELSNDFGTIAMARVGGEINSAVSDWYFNLNDNPGLNAIDGGFTVFGRVVNTVSERTGTNLLQYFRTNSTTVTITNTTGPFEIFHDLPVATTNTGAPRVSDLFVVRAGIVQRPATPDPSNSIVRISVSTQGTNVGNLDLELFDQEKPETVKNFLLYVYSGGYSNLVLHRLIRNFVVQAGHVTVTNATLTNNFQSYVDGFDFGRVTNEYGVGPELGNQFGSIAMARVSGDTNSASLEWFINLTNNAFLDRVDGGFTVFGRVINTLDPRNGTNLLHYFNQVSNRQAISGSPFEFFDDMAVSSVRYSYLTNRTVVTNDMLVMTNFTIVTNTLLARFTDLYVAQASLLQGGQPRDTSRPSVTVNVPLRTTNASFMLGGTARDNQEVARVLYDLSDGSRLVAAGRSNWMADLALAPGTNRFTVRSIDFFGNVSPPLAVTVFYSVPRPLALEIRGLGKVTGITNGQIFEVGVDYRVTAKPKGGNYFLDWGGGFFSRDRDIYFTMQEGYTNVIARFTNTFLALTPGTYEGVFASSVNSPSRNAGFISIKLGKGGVYSGKLQPLGLKFTVRGQLNASGQSVITGQYRTNYLQFGVGLLEEGAEGISGYYTDGHFYSPFTLYRVQTYSAAHPTPLAGTYTFNISPPLGTNALVTDGSGFGSVTIDPLGHVTVAGRLADDTPIAQKTALLKGDHWPFLSTVKNGDSVLGLVSFASNQTFSANLKWFGPTFPGGTNQNVRLNGSPYAPAPARLFSWTNGLVTLSGDGLAEPITSEVVLNDNGTLTVSGNNTNNLQLTVTNATGWVTGSFTRPGAGALTVLRGAVLQSSNSAAGFFPGTPRPGGFTIRAAP